MVPLTLCCLFFSLPSFYLVQQSATSWITRACLITDFILCRHDLIFPGKDFVWRTFFMFISTTIVLVALPYLIRSWQGDVRGNDQPPDRNCARRLSFHTAPESLIKYDHGLNFFLLLRFSSNPEMKSFIVMLKSGLRAWQMLPGYLLDCTGLSIFEVATVSNWGRDRGRYPTRCITTTISPMNHQGTQRYEVQKCAQHRSHTGFGISGTVWESNWWSRNLRTRTYGLDCKEPPCIAHVP